jgi:hypothetical protein
LNGTDNGQFLIANATPGAAPQFDVAVDAATATTNVPFTRIVLDSLHFIVQLGTPHYDSLRHA